MKDTEQKTAIIDALRKGGVVVVRTDTIYGVIALASNESAVEKVYSVKHRNLTKQCIILVDEVPEDSPYAQYINDFSGNAVVPTTIVVPAHDEATWVLRGGDTIAYRVTRDPLLKAVIKEVGPVIAPSANPEGLEPARTIQTAKEYFGDTVDVYIDGGEVPKDVAPSEILSVDEAGKLSIVRSRLEGANSSEMIIKEHHSAGGLIFNNDAVLLIVWDPPRSTYDFPKGHIEAGESAEVAAVREVFEETGYKTKVSKYIDSNDYYFQTPKGEWRHKVVDYFLLDLIDPQQYEVARELYETFENAWVPISEAPNVITKPINAAVFNKALAMRETMLSQ